MDNEEVRKTGSLRLNGRMPDLVANGSWFVAQPTKELLQGWIIHLIRLLKTVSCGFQQNLIFAKHCSFEGFIVLVNSSGPLTSEIKASFQYFI